MVPQESGCLEKALVNEVPYEVTAQQESPKMIDWNSDDIGEDRDQNERGQ